NLTTGMALIGVLLLLAYFLTRFSEVVVGSASAEVRFRIRRTSIQEASEFVDALESAKNLRYFASAENRPSVPANKIRAVDLQAERLEHRRVRTLDAGMSVYKAPD